MTDSQLFQGYIGTRVKNQQARKLFDKPEGLGAGFLLPRSPGGDQPDDRPVSGVEKVGAGLRYVCSERRGANLQIFAP